MIIVLTAFLLPSCQTTGDPSTGGIFWSEKKAQQRMQDKQSELDHVKDKTTKEQHAARERDAKIRALQQ